MDRSNDNKNRKINRRKFLKYGSTFVAGSAFSLSAACKGEKKTEPEKTTYQYDPVEKHNVVLFTLQTAGGLVNLKLPAEQWEEFRPLCVLEN